jgi:hypothetical protein
VGRVRHLTRNSIIYSHNLPLRAHVSRVTDDDNDDDDSQYFQVIEDGW